MKNVTYLKTAKAIKIFIRIIFEKVNIDNEVHVHVSSPEWRQNCTVKSVYDAEVYRNSQGLHLSFQRNFKICCCVMPLSIQYSERTGG